MRHTKDFFFNPSYRRPSVLKTLLKKTASQNRIELSNYRNRHAQHQGAVKQGLAERGLKEPAKRAAAV